MMQQPRRCLAYVLAFVMVFSSLTVSPLDVFGEDEGYANSEEMLEEAQPDVIEESASQVDSGVIADALSGELSSAPVSDEIISEDVPELEEEPLNIDWEEFFSQEETEQQEELGQHWVAENSNVYHAMPSFGGFVPSNWDRDSDSVMEEDSTDRVDPMNIGRPPAPIFSRRGGVLTGSSTLNITADPRWADATVRITFDGSVPKVCAAYRAQVREHGWAVGHKVSEDGPYQDHLYFNPTPQGATTFEDRLHSWQAWNPGRGQTNMAGCTGCAWILRPGDTIPVDAVGATGQTANAGVIGAPGDHISPMSNYGVGRGNPGAWNAPWSINNVHEDSAYMSPHNTQAVAPGGWTAQTRPDWIKGAQGYYRTQPIYTGMAIRARAFDHTGQGGDTETQTYIVNKGSAGPESFSNWNNLRIVSIVMPPEHFAHPITGIYRNWDRGFKGRSDLFGSGTGQQGAQVGSGTSSEPDYWVIQGANNVTQRNGWGHIYPNVDQPVSSGGSTWHVPTWPWFWSAPIRDSYPYLWQAQIRAGLWDGMDALGNVVPGMNGGYGLPVRRNTQGRALISGIDNNSTVSTQNIRHVANVEMYDEQGNMLINQLANAWTFGNWSRAFPTRSIRLNFNQGDQSRDPELTGRSGDVRGLTIVPQTLKHYLDPGGEVNRFRHLNLRYADVEGTDARDMLSMWLAHPLRPTIQHGTWAAVFVNGEFWAMQNVQVHRHAHLIGQKYDIDATTIQLESNSFIEEIGNLYINYPPRTANALERTQRPAVEGRSVDVTSGTRRTALGNQTADKVSGANIEGHTGYARRVPTTFPATHPQAGQAVPTEWQGASHLTKEWYDYLNTVVCMDDFIDWFIVYYHLENWDSMSNNVEMWRTGVHRGVNMYGDDMWRAQPSVNPGAYGGDGRWRFAIQDFDNAIFHGTSNWMDYFTAMSSPTCHGEGTCNVCGNANGEEARTNQACMGEPIGSGVPMSFFLDNSTWRRPERSSRIFRVLFQNPYFRTHFAARYSTYTGTAFHPARAERLVREVDNVRAPFIARHFVKWGMFNTGPQEAWPNGSWGPQLVPWLTNEFMTPVQRVQNWRGSIVERGRWAPHTLGGGPEDNWDEIGWNASSGRPQPPTGNNPPNAQWSPLRGQSVILALRAAPAGRTYTYSNTVNGVSGSFRAHSTPTSASAPGGVALHQNSIEHIRNYYSRGPGSANGNPRPGNPYAAYGREHMGLNVGNEGESVNVNWRVSGGTESAALAGQVGWLNVAGAHIRPELYQFLNGTGTSSFFGREVAGFPAFNIGNFTARYLRNMPILVTANAQPGFRFSHFTVSGTGATAHSGSALIEMTGRRQNISGTPLTGQINEDTIWVTPAADNVTVTAHFVAETNLAPIINQVFGLGSPQSDGVTVVSHGFIELYNPHSTAVDLTGRSLQIQNIDNGAPVAGVPNSPDNTIARPWQVFPLSGTLQPGRSYLILSEGSNTWHNSNTDPAMGPVPRLVLQGDTTMNIPLSNRNFTAAIVQGTDPLPVLLSTASTAEQNRVLDLVGARNEAPPRDQVHNIWGPHPARPISRTTAVRRINTAAAPSTTAPGNPRNTRNNHNDFEAIRYGDANMGIVYNSRPRRSADGAWLAPVSGGRAVTLVGGGTGSNIFPETAAPGQWVGFQAGVAVPDPLLGQRVFSHWSVSPATGITIVNETCPYDAYFVMPSSGSGAITVTANWIELNMPEPSIVINHVHGQGPAGTNAISHGFIELVNSTNIPQSLRGKSIQIMNDDDGIWRVRSLPNVDMAPGSSFLIISSDWFNDGSGAAYVPAAARVNNHRPRYIIPTVVRADGSIESGAFDMQWNQRFSNSSMSVALVDGVFPLSARIAQNEWPIIIDLVGARNTASDTVSAFLGTGPARQISRQRTVRRYGNAVNSRDNMEDFESHDFRATGLTNAEVELYRPRYSGDTFPGGTVRILNGGIQGANATPNVNVAANTVVNISAGTTPGRDFSGWTVVSGNVTLQDPSARNTRFTMPAGAPAVVVAANWEAMELLGSASLDLIFNESPFVPEPIWTLEGRSQSSVGTGESNPPAPPAFVSRSGGDANTSVTVSNGTISITGRRATSNSDGIFLWLTNLGVSLPSSYQMVIGGTITGAASGTNMRVEGRGPNAQLGNPAHNIPISGGTWEAEINFPGTHGWNGSHLRIFTNAAGVGASFTINKIEILDMTGMSVMSVLPVDDSTDEMVLGASDGVVPMNTIGLQQATGSGIIHVPPQNPYEALTNYTLPTVTVNGAPVAPPQFATWSVTGGSAAPGISFPGNAIRSSHRQGGSATITAHVYGPADAPIPQPHPITVNGGSANVNQAAQNATITLTPSAPGPGQIFIGWTASAGITTADIRYANSASMANFTMPNAPVTVTANFATLHDSPLIIRQVYGNGGAGANIISHGFIELFNPSNAPVPLTGLTLRVANGQGPQPWASLPLSGTVPANSSWLIVSTVGVNTTPIAGVPRVVIPPTGVGSADQQWNLELSNENMAIAIVADAAELPQIISTAADYARIIDLVGVHRSGNSMHTANYLGSGSAGNISRSATVRRKNGIQNTLDNAEDFERLDYRAEAMTDEELAIVRPRSSNSAAERNITIVGGGRYSEASPGVAAANTQVTINAGIAPIDTRFSGWTAVTGGVTLASTSNAETTFTMGSQDVSVTANFVPSAMPAQGLMINQVHGQGGQGTNAFSHGFIELFNPTNADISLAGMSIQVMNGDGISEWDRLNLSGSVPARGSYLIGSRTWDPPAGHTPRVILQPDIMFPDTVQFSNNTMVVALVRGTTTLPSRISDWSNIQDLVGAWNSDNPTDEPSHWLGNNAARDISRQRAVRRKNFVDTRDNREDFESHHYGNLSAAEVEANRPRNSTAGSWAVGGTVTVESAGTGAGATPPEAVAGATVTINAGTPPAGQRFVRWQTTSPISIANETTATTTFEMPNPAINVTVTAVFEASTQPAPGLQIHQAYGHGSAGGNAISHSFVEIYNPTAEPIILSQYTLQIQTSADPGANGTPPANIPWQSFPLSGTLQPNTSFLIRGAASQPTGTVAYSIPETGPGSADMTIPIALSNRSFSVALVVGSTLLDPHVTDLSNVQDMLGAFNSDRNGRDRVDNYSTSPIGNPGISRGRAVRRKDFSDERNNSIDFTDVNYASLTAAEVAAVRPRSTSDGAWGGGSPDNVTVTFNLNGGTFNGSTASIVRTIPRGENAAQLSSNPTRTNFDFVGWALEGTTVVLTGAQLSQELTGVQTSKVLVAQWTPTGGVLRGDASGDGRLTSADSTLIARWLLQNEAGRDVMLANGFNQTAADVDQSGTITTADLTLLSRMLIGLTN